MEERVPCTVLAISPHLDDAVLSVGAQLADMAAHGDDIEICTLFAGVPGDELSPAASARHRAWGLPANPTAVLARRDEDLAALAALGVRGRHLEFVDAAYRMLPEGGWRYERSRSLFDPTLPEEPRLARELSEAVARECTRVRPDLLLTCGALGEHVDHRLTRMAVTAVAGQGAVRLRLWEDLPYAMRYSSETSGRTSDLLRARRPAWERKWEAVACYASQLQLFWPRPGDGSRALGDYAAAVGGGEPAERCWDQAPNLTDPPRLEGPRGRPVVGAPRRSLTNSQGSRSN